MAVGTEAEYLARLRDRQHDPALRDRLTYVDADGERCATAFLIPRSRDDVARRGAAMYDWATWSRSCSRGRNRPLIMRRL